MSPSASVWLLVVYWAVCVPGLPATPAVRIELFASRDGCLEQKAKLALTRGPYIECLERQVRVIEAPSSVQADGKNWTGN